MTHNTGTRCLICEHPLVPDVDQMVWEWHSVGEIFTLVHYKIIHTSMDSDGMQTTVRRRWCMEHDHYMTQSAKRQVMIWQDTPARPSPIPPVWPPPVSPVR